MDTRSCGRGAVAGAFATGLALAASFALSCASSQAVSESVSTSVESISTSLRTMSRSISRSSESGGDAAVSDAYRRDVRAVTAASVQAGAGSPEFLRDLGRVAREHGIVDWEGRRDTYVAIGAGLRDAGVDDAALDRLADDWSGGDVRALAWVREGYGS